METRRYVSSMRVFLCACIFIMCLALLVSFTGCVSPLISAANKGDVQTVRRLLDTGANVHEKDIQGRTPLMRATENGHTHVVKTLLERGANPNQTSASGTPPLWWAAWKGHIEIARLLLDAGARPDIIDRDGDTALKEAAENCHTEIVRILLERGADVNIGRGGTALHDATFCGDPKIVRMLLDAGADIDMVTGYPWKAQYRGKTALQLAQQQGNATIARMLREVKEEKKMKQEVEYKIKKAEQERRIAEKLMAAKSEAPAREKHSVKSDVDELPAVKVKPKKDAYAIVIGIESYREKLPKVDFAAKDARTVTEYLTKVMGYPEENVVTLLNDRAAKSDLKKYLEKWLSNNLEKDGTVFIYFSGHGAPDPTTGDSFIVPYDGDPAYIDETGYPLNRLYKVLGKLPAKEMIVMLDSCFSGAGGRSVIAEGARPLVVTMDTPGILSKNMVVLSAASGCQISSTYKKKRHGLFTYFMLKGLKGEGDTNGDGAIEARELFDYIRPNVNRIARKIYNNGQSPQLIAPEKVKVFLRRGSAR